jgi:hypothetical protein
MGISIGSYLELEFGGTLPGGFQIRGSLTTMTFTVSLVRLFRVLSSDQGRSEGNYIELSAYVWRGSAGVVQMKGSQLPGA